MILGAKIKRQSTASFDTAWSLTASFEGGWDVEGSDEGHYFPQSASNKYWFSPLPAPKRVKIGTAWGITGQFLYDFVPGYQGANMPTEAVMAAIGEDKAGAGKIWKDTCWQWMKGDKIQSQKVANILFDCFVRAQGLAILFDPACDKQTYLELRTRSENDHKDEKTKKLCVLSDGMIAKLNKMKEEDAIKKIKGIWLSKYAKTNTLFRWNAILKGTQHKFYNEAVTTRKLLFFTQKGCAPCLQLKPTCEALASKHNFVFEEVDIRTDSGKILMAEYRIGATPEVVLINGDTTVSFGVADLFNDKLELYLAGLISKPVEPDAQTESDGNWALPLAAGALAWYHFKSKKRVGNTDDTDKWLIGGGLLLLLWWLSSDGAGGGALTAEELDAILTKTLKNEGPWEAETEHTRKDKGNYHRGKGPFLGTSWGITANFLEDWYGTKSFSSDSIKKISYDDAKKILLDTVMTRARIADIQDKWIASFFFDWMLHRPSTCLEYVCLKAFRFNDADYQLVRKGFYSTARIPDVLINHLNGEARKGNFENIKLWRLDHLENTSAYAGFRDGIRKRINSYQYGN